MRKVTLPAAFGTGLMAGLLFGIGLKTGQDISEEGISLLVLTAFCGSVKTQVANPCNQLWLYGIMFSLVGLVVAVTDFLTGGIAYVLGLILGFGLAISH